MPADDEEYRARAEPGGFSNRNIVAVRDVIVCAQELDESVTDEEWQAHPPVGAPRSLYPNAVQSVDLGARITLTALPEGEAAEIMDACEPLGWKDATRQFGQQYSFVRERPVEIQAGTGSGFDEDSQLQNALALSRLIRDNGFSRQYAARVKTLANGQLRVWPLGRVEGSAVYRLRRGREWLDGPEAEELRALLEAHRADEDKLPPRVGRALWRTEHSTWSRWAEVTLYEIVGGLEALTKVGRGQLTWQFKHRIARLSDDIGIDGVDEALCGRMYAGRSDWVHGSHMELFGREGGPPKTDDEAAQVLAEIAKMQEVLRRACRKAIEDPPFRAGFASAPAIERRWPAPSTPANL